MNKNTGKPNSNKNNIYYDFNKYNMQIRRNCNKKILDSDRKYCRELYF